MLISSPKSDYIRLSPAIKWQKAPSDVFPKSTLPWCKWWQLCQFELKEKTLKRQRAEFVRHKSNRKAWLSHPLKINDKKWHVARGAANNYTSGNKCGLLSGQFPWVRRAEMKTDIWIYHIADGRLRLLLGPLATANITRSSFHKEEWEDASGPLLKLCSGTLGLSLSLSLAHTHSIHTHRQHSQVQTISGISHFKKNIFCFV